ncbi:MAG: N-acetylmuramoyl-L-alanine amidase [Desulfatiglandaceae bacterium]
MNGRTEKLKRTILKDLYSENLEALHDGSGARRESRRRQRRPKRKRALPYFIGFLVALPLFFLGLYLLYPQDLVAIGLGLKEKNAPLPVAEPPDRVFAGLPHILPPEDLLPEDPMDKEFPQTAPVIEVKRPAPNGPEDYLVLVDPMDVSLAELFHLGIKTIAIDPGHGGRDPGAIGHSGLMEKDVTLDIALRLRRMLKEHGNYRILMTRDKDVSLSLKARAQFANQNGADLLISIHVNYIPEQPLVMIETYYFGAQTDAYTLEIAERENRGSEYLMAEFKDMIERISDQFKHQESKFLAMCIQRNLVRNIQHQNGTAVNRGIKPAPFVVLLGADMPSVLAEVTCISSEAEERKLADPAYREEIARYLEGGIVEYLEKSGKKPIEGDQHYVNKR